MCTYATNVHGEIPDVRTATDVRPGDIVAMDDKEGGARMIIGPEMQVTYLFSNGAMARSGALFDMDDQDLVTRGLFTVVSRVAS